MTQFLSISTECSVRFHHCCFPLPISGSPAALRIAGLCKCPSIALCHRDLFLNATPSLQPDCCPFHFVLIAPKANPDVCSLIKTRWIQIAPCELEQRLERSQFFQEIIITFFVCMCVDEHCQYMQVEFLSFFCCWQPAGGIQRTVWPTILSVPIPIIHRDLRSLHLPLWRFFTHLFQFPHKSSVNPKRVWVELGVWLSESIS